jgi:hypothetical protein
MISMDLNKQPRCCSCRLRHDILKVSAFCKGDELFPDSGKAQQCATGLQVHWRLNMKRANSGYQGWVGQSGTVGQLKFPGHAPELFSSRPLTNN